MRPFALCFLVALAVAGCDSNGSDEPTLTECENTSREIEVEEGATGTSPARADATDTVRINYVGMLEDGTEFDSARNVPFDLRSSISGFREGVSGMRIGGSRRITIPPYRAYGTRSQNRIVNGETVEIIPACATLVFEVDLLDILT